MRSWAERDLIHNAAWKAPGVAHVDNKILVQGEEQLQNPYHVIVVKHDGTNVGCAKAFSSWITSAPTQKLIAGFGKAKYGQALFHPDAAAQ